MKSLITALFLVFALASGTSVMARCRVTVTLVWLKIVLTQPATTRQSFIEALMACAAGTEMKVGICQKISEA